MSEDEPDYMCSYCEQAVDEDEMIVCGCCRALLCPKCGEELQSPEEFHRAEAQAARDAELEEEYREKHSNSKGEKQ